MPQANTQGDGGTADAQQTAATAGDNTANRAAPGAGPQGTQAPAAPAADSTRAADVLALCQRHGAADLAHGLLSQNATIDQARAAILDRMDAADQSRRGGSTVSVQTVRDEHETRMRGMEEALMNKLDSRAQLTDLGRNYRGLSLTEMAREALEGLGVSTRGLSRNEIATRAFATRAGGFHTTGDFTSLLGEIGRASCRERV